MMTERRIIVYSTTSAAPEPETEVELDVAAVTVGEPVIGLAVGPEASDWAV